MQKISDERVREIAQAQRTQRNVQAMHRVAQASGKTTSLLALNPPCGKCNVPLTPEERLLHAIFGTCAPETDPTLEIERNLA